MDSLSIHYFFNFANDFTYHDKDINLRNCKNFEHLTLKLKFLFFSLTLLDMLKIIL